MQKKHALEIYKNLQKNLTDRKFLKRAGLTKKALNNILEQWELKNSLLPLLTGKRFSCEDILSLCEKEIAALFPTPQEGWLAFTCEYIINSLFPEKTPHEDIEKYRGGVVFYLEVLDVFFNYEKEHMGFDPLIDFAFINPKELEETDFSPEYRNFIKVFNENNIYALMRISREISYYNTLGHIAGVHYLAMHIAYQLKKTNVPIDLALISGASAGHDIGKFGCRPGEESRVPYLHYFYTDQWFRDNNMPGIGHIAANHSTWDLELENLPVESLVLIYADFRVKCKPDNGSKETINFYSLDESFEVILNKLDNVDEAKKQRYIFVYSKLKDFEDYMVSLGINTGFESCEPKEVIKKDVVLLNAPESIEKLKYLAIEHNISLMHKFSNETSFGNILEAARSEKNWKNIRAYINIFEEYFTYMTQKQKLMTLSFLYELLMHREGDIRRQSAGLIGKIIVSYDEEYRKEVPRNSGYRHQKTDSLSLWRKYLDMIIYPDHKINPQHKGWIGYALKIVVDSVLSFNKPQESSKYIKEYLKYCDDTDIDDSTAFVLLDSLSYLPLALCTREDLLKMAGFALKLAGRSSLIIKTAVLILAQNLTSSQSNTSVYWHLIENLLKTVEDEGNIRLIFLKYKIASNLRQNKAILAQYQKQIYCDCESISEIFLENLKVATPWITKIANISFLLDWLNNHDKDQVLHIATHFSNLVKVSERIVVRHKAGAALISVAPLLSLDQCNEIAIELTRGLEIGEYEFSKYIPEYLGQLALFLHPKELDELLGNLRSLLEGSNERVGSVVLNTLGVIIQHYPVYISRFPESTELNEGRKNTILGMLLGGVANYNELVSQEAFLVISKYIFGSSLLTHEDKYNIFRQIYKKLLTLLADKENSALFFFNNAASLNHIYRFIADYIFRFDKFELKEEKKIAFFPGTFDPFSLSHKGIVKEIRNLGFEVYLALDEFSWSKKTQPRMIRRQIINMSVADEFNVYLFPDDIPVNIGNPKDLRRLRRLFPGKEIYIVVGSDVIENASSYKSQPQKGSIHHFNHIVFNRNSYESPAGIKKAGEESGKGAIKGELVELSLPLYLEDISSTRIRENIDYNRDISNLIDPVAQKFIYDYSLYLRAPQYKQVLRADDIYFEHIKELDETSRQQIFEMLAVDLIDLNIVKDYMEHNPEQLVVIKDNLGSPRPLGFVAFHQISPAGLYDEFQSTEIAEYVRQNTSGKIIVLTGIYVDKRVRGRDLVQWVITEALAHCLKNDFTYALYRSVGAETDPGVINVLERQGFQRIPCSDPNHPVYAVDMKFPVVLLENIQNTVKGPFNTNERVLEVMTKAHRRLQYALTRLYPGGLVLSVNSGVMNCGLVKKIARINKIPSDVLPMPTLGKYMCVPFGKILRGAVVPNTVTKTLHTEKMFEPDIKKFKITAYPFYSPLYNQVKTIKSFNRPVILVDDILHKGYRLRELDPIFKQEEVKIKKILVGILSGRGKDLMSIQNRQVESVYFIPNLRLWFVESTLYPFIGGDAVHRGDRINGNLIPSVNMILPYVTPRFIAGSSPADIYDFSLTCLENARDILTVLEAEYQRLFERNLTLNRLGDVILTSRCPDKGPCVSYDLNLSPSVYVNNDIEALTRLKHYID